MKKGPGVSQFNRLPKHVLIGRDSIQAINQNKQATPQLIQQLDTADIALVASISKALKTSSEYDLEEMRSVCQMRDISRHGLLPRKMVCAVVVVFFFFLQC